MVRYCCPQQQWQMLTLQRSESPRSASPSAEKCVRVGIQGHFHSLRNNKNLNDHFHKLLLIAVYLGARSGPFYRSSRKPKRAGSDMESEFGSGLTSTNFLISWRNRHVAPFRHQLETQFQLQESRLLASEFSFIGVILSHLKLYRLSGVKVHPNPSRTTARSGKAEDEKSNSAERSCSKELDFRKGCRRASPCMLKVPETIEIDGHLFVNLERQHHIHVQILAGTNVTNGKKWSSNTLPWKILPSNGTAESS